MRLDLRCKNRKKSDTFWTMLQNHELLAKKNGLTHNKQHVKFLYICRPN